MHHISIKKVILRGGNRDQDLMMHDQSKIILESMVILFYFLNMYNMHLTELIFHSYTSPNFKLISEKAQNETKKLLDGKFRSIYISEEGSFLVTTTKIRH